MIKLSILILGLVVGFGGGVYWASHNPEQATQLSAEEERRFLEAQMKITQQIQAKLDRLQGKTAAPAADAGNATQPSAAPVVKDVQADARRQQEEIKQRLDALKK
jgi:hypothetical protein